MGGRNGGAMGKSNLGQKRHETKDKVVTMPRTDGGEDAEAAANGDEKAATEKDEKAKRKGAKKALRHAVKEAVKQNKEQIAGSLVTRTVGGDMHCAAMMVSLMEKKKKKDGEDDDDWDGPGLADILVPGQLWREKAAAKQAANEEEKETEAA
jgi:hypothetical protein